jgi:probable phosphoglycerate mutase
MTIYLVRHGRAAAGVEDLDPPLDDVGRQQAQHVAMALASITPYLLVTSPLRHTRETAAPIAAVLDLDPQVRDEVAEVFDPSMPVEQRRDMLGPFMAGRWSEQPPHLRAWRDRVVATLLELGLAAEAAMQDLVVVSHYIAIGVAIGEATGDDRVVPVPMANASITTLGAGHGGLSLRNAASTDHLPPGLVTGVNVAIAGTAPPPA